MKLEETLVGLMTLLVVTSASTFFGQGGLEYGRIRAGLQSQLFNRGSNGLATSSRDGSLFAGQADQRARWAGQSAVTDNSRGQQDQAAHNKGASSASNFGRFSSGFANIAKQIQDQARRHQVAIKDDAKYSRNNLQASQGDNAINAKSAAFKNGGVSADKINYAFNKKFNKSSSENGGYEEENGRNHKKVDVIDEREKDLNLKRGDLEVSRQQSDQEASDSNQEWNSSAAQKQAQDGKFGFADRKLDQANERSDDKRVNFGRNDSRFQETESGRDEATQLAKKLAEKKVGYNNEAGASADVNRNVADQKYYGGEESPGGSPATGHHAAAAAPTGDTARLEGSGGATKVGFDEAASQHEKGDELASSKALNSAQAVNDYQRNKDKVAFDQRAGLEDNSQGQFKQGLTDANSQGFSANSAAAAKAAKESDKSSSNSKSASNLDAKEKNDQEALRDRSYFRKVQNDDSLVFSRRKQFFHNKKEGGNNDEKLLYDRQKNEHNFGAVEEAEAAKQNSFKNLKQDGKQTAQTRNFEDAADRRNSLQLANQAKQGASQGFQNQQAKSQEQAQAASNGFEKALSQSAKDDSESSASNKRQSLQDQSSAQKQAQEDSRKSAKDVAADIEYVQPGTNPLGGVSASDFVSKDLVQIQPEKRPKDHSLDNVVVNIQPIDTPPSVQRPKQPSPVPSLPPVQQVKAYQPPKHTKQEVTYDTGRPSGLANFGRFGQASAQPRFSKIQGLSLFRGPRTNFFGGSQQQQPSVPRPRFSFSRLGGQGPTANTFSRGVFGNRFGRGGW